MKLGHPFTKFWNSLNDLASPGNGTILRIHDHKADQDVEDDYDWNGMALYSADEKHRYVVTRVWNRNDPLFGAVLLNPSTATEYQLDPTVDRVLTRARRELIYGGLVLMNIFAFRATDPKNMREQKDPIGRENDRVIKQLLPHCAKVMCGWGTHGAYRDRHAHVEAAIRGMDIVPHVIDLTKEGFPVHPLYQSYTKKLKPWT